MAFTSPSWIFDFRKNARFDVIAGGRMHAFRIFERYSAQYVDVQGMLPRGLPFLDQKRQSVWQKLFRCIFMREKVTGPYLVLCDDVNRFCDLSQAIINGLGSATKSKLSLSIVSTKLSRRTRIAFREVM
ncbi:hypothetical protein [Stakelama pacifica]|uniref:hypothetical protein n=1 Tax=Stakelama pacifica TaxID=517720 RepID=UPI00105D5852|nr:hypothetical protein [Stakelama pacifica]